MIDKKFLENKYLKNMETYKEFKKEYIEGKRKYTGSEPKRLFKDGEFNVKNWNGGDDVIRDFFQDLKCGTIEERYIIDVEDTYHIMICHCDRVDDISFATILIDGNVYYFSWYKNRGTTETAKLDGKILTEEEYIKLLNAIELTGYKFRQ